MSANREGLRVWVCVSWLIVQSQAHTQLQRVWPRSVWSVDSQGVKGQVESDDWGELIALFRLVLKCALTHLVVVKFT